jgi:hypothetical protein
MRRQCNATNSHVSCCVDGGVAVAGRLGVSGLPSAVLLLLPKLLRGALLWDELLRDNELLPDKLLLVELLSSATLLRARVLRDNQLLPAGGVLQSGRGEAAHAYAAAKRQVTASRRFPSDYRGKTEMLANGLGRQVLCRPSPLASLFGIARVVDAAESIFGLRVL